MEPRSPLAPLVVLLALIGAAAAWSGDVILEAQAVVPLPSGADGTLRIAAIDQGAPPGNPTTMDAAAIPIGELPDPLLSPQGIIDSVDAYASSEPGLTPLAQARNPLSSWMAAVDRLGPLTPLCDPLFVGTAFPLADAAMATAQGAIAAAAAKEHSNSSAGNGSGEAAADAALAALLNSLAVAGQPARIVELCQASADGSQLLRSTDGGELLAVRTPGLTRCRLAVAPVRREGSGSRFTAPVVEGDVQSGHMVAHTLGSLDGFSGIAAIEAVAEPPVLRHTNALTALQDAGIGIGAMRFAQVVEAAGLWGVLSEGSARCTVFLPSDKALEALVPADAWGYLASTAEGVALAEAIAARHWMPGMVLGSIALRARAVAGIELTTADSGSLRPELQQRGLQGAGLLFAEVGAVATEVGAVPATAAAGPDEEPWQQTPAFDGGERLEGTLLVEGVRLVRPDAALGRRVAVHALEGVLPVPHMREHAELFTRAVEAARRESSANGAAASGAAAAAPQRGPRWGAALVAAALGGALPWILAAA
ncbi:hypothetical protein Rsub_12767 [Raphidocelis subcapitata]|uniref:FAS1 domain-containing protein n=1 Tax=Raphidocelis subcapitata TaxID=307507 RepID=A0A2V0PKI9_9CHLO|nr:hypothetical protein Rsub_12767 [Raphidocelis subcapitata]|eukprot:GBG00070.1 hypothetical protein Rsub_12767 [Raphidocelis subcapitata]